MEIHVNGKPCDVKPGTTVAGFLQENNQNPQKTVVELNKEIIPGQEFGSTVLEQGDVLEVLCFVGGG